MSANRNGLPIDSRLFIDCDMGGLFGVVERFLDIDRMPQAPRTFVRARFDPIDGHIREYVRRVSGTRERQRWWVQYTNPSRQGP